MDARALLIECWGSWMVCSLFLLLLPLFPFFRVCLGDEDCTSCYTGYSPGVSALESLSAMLGDMSAAVALLLLAEQTHRHRLQSDWQIQSPLQPLRSPPSPHIPLPVILKYGANLPHRRKILRRLARYPNRNRRHRLYPLIRQGPRYYREDGQEG